MFSLNAEALCLGLLFWSLSVVSLSFSTSILPGGRFSTDASSPIFFFHLLKNFFDRSFPEFLGSGFLCALSRERTFAVVWRVREERQVTITFSPEGRHGGLGVLLGCAIAVGLEELRSFFCLARSLVGLFLAVR